MLEGSRHFLAQDDIGRDVRQAGAICLRRDDGGRMMILLVGSRRNGRWGAPKGHIDPGETSAVAAGREAFEEAGVEGVVNPELFGLFSYRKDSTPHRYHVSVHLLEVSGIAADFPEKGVRKQNWFPLEVAISEVSQPGLRALLERLHE
ncbi:NUDIX hydrolase [Rhizobium sp. 3T7]|uniref:NUDIX hydrolase n=1 Tax=Rhizobium sp. 3T7 TaxID=2874922 RepID=UPI001CCD7713|nr:NUDIX hydrolase [Rhizobium sp. 3T7]MBZ9791589.1 NUDIX hydrolase [Rhizobium sp. 3T7]